ncbi:MAG: hypothetical protein E6I62_04480 [Chloroflexi bacterium]|nr:MAG: hypothetical protein E6I62_04480 [Chloroflexota bacterium]
MRVTHVVARAFGPFHGERLDLAPGMTVVTGPNESGKSTWHAALRLALTGLRRGRGRATAADAAIGAQHRPWDSDDWEVEAGLILDDGRAIELRQDLDGKVECSALDVGIGRDVSSEILDGTPDASRWLGLDRDSFAATVSVSQAQIMSIAEAAGGLQEQMQRAAATRGTDATAAEAIERLATYRRDAVGADTANAKGPLRIARLRLDAARQRGEDAQTRHAEHLAERGRVVAATHAAREARLELEQALAAQARHLAGEARARAARAAALAARHPERPSLVARNGTGDLVAAAILEWERRPAIPALEGPTREQLEAQLLALPDRPAGDLAAHPSVLAAVRDLEIAEETVRLLDESVIGGRAESRSRPAGSAFLVAVPLVLLAVSVALALVGQPLPALAIGSVALVAVTWGASRMFSARSRGRNEAAEWDTRRRRAGERMIAAREGVLLALRARAAPIEGDARSSWLAYRSACEVRAAEAAEALRRDAVTAQIEARGLAEETVASRMQAVESAERALREAGAAIGLAGDSQDPEHVRDALRAWQKDQAAAQEASQIAVEEWRELESLLGDNTLAELAEHATRREAIAADLEAALPAAALPPAAQPDMEELIERRRRTLAVAEAQAAELRGALESNARSLPDVAEAEEAVAAATAELSRVEATARTLDETLRLLREAQERVHRDLAPILAAAVRRWLPEVSGGAYVDVSVDPADLSIKAKEAATGIWRKARLLSEGTREQIYLLLRVAMAQHLVTTAETAPLFLDEVTAQADGRRRAARLSVLHALSADRQIVLFSHDAEVGAWAERTLAGPRDRLIRLPAIRGESGAGLESRAAIAIADARAAEPAVLPG